MRFLASFALAAVSGCALAGCAPGASSGSVTSEPRADRPRTADDDGRDGAHVATSGTDGAAYDLSLEDDAVALYGEAAGDLAGADIALGDLDGDGLSDLVVAACGTTCNYRSEGGAVEAAGYVVYGAPAADMSLAAADVRLTARAGDGSGVSVSVGDIDGDGVLEVAYGAPGHDDAGAVFITWPLDEAEVDIRESRNVIRGEHADDGAGQWVGFLGDLDGDGAEELGVTAPYADGPAPNSGLAYIFSSRFSGEHFLADAAPITVGHHVPSELTRVGDLDGDGVDDLVVGWQWYEHDGGWPDRYGALYVYFGPVPPGDTEEMCDVFIPGRTASGLAGHITAGVGDVDGDGRDDFVASGSYYDGPRMYLFTSTGVDHVEDAAGSYSVDDEHFVDVAAGDLDGDGARDLVFATSGPMTVRRQLHVVTRNFVGARDLARDDATVSTPDGTYAGADLAIADIDGDGLDDLFVSATGDDTAGLNAGAVWFLSGSAFGG